MVRVLVIDDEACIRRGVRRMLERAGFQVDEADNGRTGLDIFERLGCDVIVTDIIMPEMEGLEMVRRLRSLAPDLPIVAISGGGRISAMDPLTVAKAFGATCILHKPFGYDDLVKVVQEALTSGCVA